MDHYKRILSDLIKQIYYQFPNKIKIESNKEKVKFELDYSAAKKVSDKLGWMYYFGTEIKYDNQREFLKTFKELLKVKRALKEVYK
jgi:hypothetical protein